jgi:hypothetical protein
VKEIIFRKLILVLGKTERLVIAYNCSLKSDLRDLRARRATWAPPAAAAPTAGPAARNGIHFMLV